MILLVISGLILVGAGLFGLGYCIRQGFRIRGSKLPPEEIHGKLQKLVAVNLGSMCLAALGLAATVAGFLL